MTITAAQLTEGTVVRFQPSILRSLKLTIRLTKDAQVDTLESGSTYAVMFGYRVRPADYSASFGNRNVWCSNVERIEVVQAAQS